MLRVNLASASSLGSGSGVPVRRAASEAAGTFDILSAIIECAAVQ